MTEPTGCKSLTDLYPVDRLIGDAFVQAPSADLLFQTERDLTLISRNQVNAVMSDPVDRVIEGVPMFAAFPPNELSDGAAAKDAIKQSVARIAASGELEEIGPYRFDLTDHLG